MNELRIVVLGLGNLMRTDDAVGMLAVEQLRADGRVPVSVSLVDGGTLGLDLLHPLEGATHVLALDAIESGAPPGTLLRFAGEEIADLPISKSVHLLGFADLIGAMRLIGNAPVEIVVLGVQPEATGWGTQLTPVVQAALPELVETAVEQMARWQAASPSPPADRYTEQVQASAMAG
ncbi:MAG TPA: HyaD/HybD family hydrogenase maturation endopeptidase [Acidobacteriaceae bacterium]|jgi:hydrogenase maturation protease|nr:HyaD/HybD family hydrogenase maturation endopeptidase [Acidobacteriaceae bacterium]